MQRELFLFGIIISDSLSLKIRKLVILPQPTKKGKKPNPEPKKNEAGRRIALLENWGGFVAARAVLCSCVVRPSGLSPWWVNCTLKPVLTHPCSFRELHFFFAELVRWGSGLTLRKENIYLTVQCGGCALWEDIWHIQHLYKFLYLVKANVEWTLVNPDAAEEWIIVKH